MGDGFSYGSIFVDIHIPGELNGMELAHKIRERDQNVSIVFVTNYTNYVYDGYAVNALRYLKKPVQQQEVFSCIDIAYRHFSLLMTEGLVVETKDQRLILRYSDIRYIEAYSHYVYLSLCETDEIPKVRTRLCNFIAHLPAQLFIQCHRSYAVNLSHVRRFTKNKLTLSNAKILPVSQPYYPLLNTAFSRYYKEGHA